MASPKSSDEVTHETERIKTSYTVEEPPTIIDKAKAALHHSGGTHENAQEEVSHETPGIKTTVTIEDDSPSFFNKVLNKFGLAEQKPAASGDEK